MERVDELYGKYPLIKLGDEEKIKELFTQSWEFPDITDTHIYFSREKDLLQILNYLGAVIVNNGAIERYLKIMDDKDKFIDLEVVYKEALKDISDERRNNCLQLYYSFPHYDADLDQALGNSYRTAFLIKIALSRLPVTFIRKLYRYFSKDAYYMLSKSYPFHEAGMMYGRCITEILAVLILDSKIKLNPPEENSEKIIKDLNQKKNMLNLSFKNKSLLKQIVSTDPSRLLLCPEDYVFVPTLQKDLVKKLFDENKMSTFSIDREQTRPTLTATIEELFRVLYHIGSEIINADIVDEKFSIVSEGKFLCIPRSSPNNTNRALQLYNEIPEFRPHASNEKYFIKNFYRILFVCKVALDKIEPQLIRGLIELFLKQRGKSPRDRDISFHFEYEQFLMNEEIGIGILAAYVHKNKAGRDFVLYDEDTTKKTLELLTDSGASITLQETLRIHQAIHNILTWAPLNGMLVWGSTQPASPKIEPSYIEKTNALLKSFFPWNRSQNGVHNSGGAHRLES